MTGKRVTSLFRTTSFVLIHAQGNATRTTMHCKEEFGLFAKVQEGPEAFDYSQRIYGQTGRSFAGDGVFGSF